MDRTGLNHHLSRRMFSSRSTKPGWSGGLLLFVLAALFIAARIYCASVYRVDSDEPQHLHVVWGVSQGLVQYRDLFDNHSPLFQLLCAPLFRALGERADILVAMRMAMIPLYLSCLGCVYLICSALFSWRCAILAVLLTGFHWRFFCTSIEFRPDNLWALNWLLLLTVLVRVRPPTWRWLLAGLLAGIGFSISMKTTVMMMDLAGAGALTWFICRNALQSASPAQPARNAGLFLAGLATVPGILLARFAAKGALVGDGPNNLLYCMIRHNLIAASERTRFFTLREIAALAALAGVVWWCGRVYRSTTDRGLGARRVFLLIAGGFYPVILFVIWPLVTGEDYLALLPMVGMTVAPALLAVLEKLSQFAPRFGWCATALPSCLIAGEIAMDVQETKPWHDRTALQEQFIANTLKLADPQDYVMDSKGEMIYRNRPYFYVLEEMTRWMFKAQKLQDDIPDQMVSHAVCIVARNAERYPLRTVIFLRENYVPVAFRLLVAGRILSPEPGGNAVEFHIAVPARYALVWPTQPGEALLDGKPYTGPLNLAVGPHTLQVTKGSGGPMALLWAKAVERGFFPYYQPSEAEKLETSQARHDNIL